MRRTLRVLLGRVRVFDGIFPAMVGTFFGDIVSLAGFARGDMFWHLPGGICKTWNEKVVRELVRHSGRYPVHRYRFVRLQPRIFLHNHFSDRLGPCLLISAMSLAVLVLPYIVRSTQTSLEELPSDIRRTALALGATPDCRISGLCIDPERTFRYQFRHVFSYWQMCRRIRLSFCLQGWWLRQGCRLLCFRNMRHCRFIFIIFLAIY